MEALRMHTRQVSITSAATRQTRDYPARPRFLTLGLEIIANQAKCWLWWCGGPAKCSLKWLHLAPKCSLGRLRFFETNTEDSCEQLTVGTENSCEEEQVAPNN